MGTMKENCFLGWQCFPQNPTLPSIAPEWLDAMSK